MGLSSRVAELAVQRCHVLVVEAAGCFELRVALERSLVRRGWVRADSPADADVLLELGTAGATTRRLTDRMWAQLTGPRARLVVGELVEVEAALDRVPGLLLAGTDHERGGWGGAEDPDAPEVGEDEMAPGGIPLAGWAEDDRDGLEMDILHLPLGPGLPHWPAGLVLHCVLHGDVVASAEVERLDSGSPARRDQLGVRAARQLDAAAGVLALAGWVRRADGVRRLRDACLDALDGPGPGLAQEIRAERDRVAAGRLLRWSLRGIGTAEYDVHELLLGLLDAAATPKAGDRPVTGLLERLPDLAAGMELAGCRLLVTALGPYLDLGITAPEPVDA